MTLLFFSLFFFLLVAPLHLSLSLLVDYSFYWLVMAKKTFSVCRDLSPWSRQHSTRSGKSARCCSLAAAPDDVRLFFYNRRPRFQCTWLHISIQRSFHSTILYKICIFRLFFAFQMEMTNFHAHPFLFIVAECRLQAAAADAQPASQLANQQQQKNGRSWCRWWNHGVGLDDDENSSALHYPDQVIKKNNLVVLLLSLLGLGQKNTLGLSTILA